jgi:hypothetical protein
MGAAVPQTSRRCGIMQQLLGLNQAFENVIFGLERMEKASLFDNELVTRVRATQAKINEQAQDCKSCYLTVLEGCTSRPVSKTKERNDFRQGDNTDSTQ